MKKRIRYTDEPLGDLRVVADFLPSPSELAFREGVDRRLVDSRAQANFNTTASKRVKNKAQRTRGG